MTDLVAHSLSGLGSPFRIAKSFVGTVG
jgi:hypothetical protein